MGQAAGLERPPYHPTEALEGPVRQPATSTETDDELLRNPLGRVRWNAEWNAPLAAEFSEMFLQRQNSNDS